VVLVASAVQGDARLLSSGPLARNSTDPKSPQRFPSNRFEKSQLLELCPRKENKDE
jgi:hypothetical protein